MKRLLQLLLVFGVIPTTFAQTYGNEWINYNQKYYAFNVYSTGIYRINQVDLVASNIDTLLFSSANIQLFGKEKEIPILVVDGGDNQFNTGDYILFYAERNNGWLDSTVYKNPTDIGNPGYSLYNDTIQYFFTWNGSSSNLRFIPDLDTDYGSYTPIDFVTKEVYSSYSNGYAYSTKQGDATGSIYSAGEGWMYTELAANAGNVEANVSIPTANLYAGSGAPQAQIHVSSTGNNNSAFSGTGNHHVRFEIGPTNTLLYDDIFTGYRMTKFDQNLSVSSLTSGGTNFRFRVIDDQGADVDRQTLNYWKLSYPRIPHANGQPTDLFQVPFNSTATKSRIDLQGVPGTNVLAFYYGTTPRLLTATLNAGNWQVLAPNVAGGSPSTLVVADIDQSIVVTNFKAVNGTGQFTDFSTLSTEEALLMVYHPSLQTVSVDYAAYRSSPNGGGYNVIFANINELYQQFGGGIEKHINGIRRFAHFTNDLATDKPVGLFLMGKGIGEAKGSRQDPSLAARNLIPSFGNPSSDIAITSGLNGTYWEPLIPTGRIAIETAIDLQNYLNKVMQYDAAQDQNSGDCASQDWQKQVLHFVGGSTINEQTSFQSYMNANKTIIEDSLYGGNVTNYFKTSSDPLDPVVVSSVTNRISDGVSLMTFFGHSAASNNGFEINIDEPSNWENSGKYPVVIGLSCHNGDMFNSNPPDEPTTTEKFVNLPNEGAIAFISTVEVGYDGYLSNYSNRLYRQFSYNNYGGTIGQQMKNTILETQIIGDNNTILETTCQQMALHGDPMLRLNWHSKPEIEITSSSIYFTPQDITLAVDSIDVNVILKNLGLAITDTFYVEITRDFPNSSIDSVYLIPIPELNYLDTLHLRIPLQANIGIGFNQFQIAVDLPSVIAEKCDEFGNNSVNKSLFINVDGIAPVYPYDFAVVPRDSVTVKASTINPIATVRTYLFELDTTDLYNSPQYRKFSVTGLGGVKEVNPSQWTTASGSSFPLICADSGVYFWRVALDSSVIVWSEFSFQYIEGKEGWGQDHFFQFKKNNFFSLDYDRLNRKRSFSASVNREIGIDVFHDERFENLWSLDGSDIEYGLCGADLSFYVGVMDPVTLQPWGTHYGTSNPDHSFGNVNDLGACRGRVEEYFIFRQNDPVQLAGMRDMLINQVPNGHYIVVYSPISTDYSEIDINDPLIYSMFDQLGSDSIAPGRDEQPFAFFCKKGDTNSVAEQFCYSTSDEIHLRKTIVYNNNSGLESTPLIGPATEWKTVFWQRDSLELLLGDSTSLHINYFDAEGNQQGTIDTVFTPNDSIVSLNGIVNAALYPFIQLSVFYSDKVFFTPAQVDRLHVLFSPVPEAAIDGTTAYFLSPDPNTLNEGQSVSFAVDVKNISDHNMDSLLVNYWVEDANRVRHYITYPRQDSLLVNEVLRDTIQFSTLGYAGLNSFWMEVNPYINLNTQITDQPEQHHFNNVLQIPFTVSGDDVHPILDVTFNGQHILNGDIVAPESEIYITLKDDNPYLVMDDVSDTTLFGIYLTDPSGTQRRIPFTDGLGNTVMQWIPADAQNKKFKIIYPGLFEADGVYTLFVQGTDRSGNVSGDIEYRINFEVIHESSITYLLNYPNPFTTSTRFVFTVTGSTPPEDILIQIMTVTGRVVREITEDQLGPINIGRNISEYAWDGTDEFGDRLANGVYLYRVKAKINGEDIKHRDSGADTHFKKEFGKMYLFR